MINQNKLFNKIPLFPLSALIFYITIFILWSLNFIPPPSEIILFLESLYQNYGLLGLFCASFLEGIVYLGLYFPGSFIIALAVFLSDGSFNNLITISIVVACALSLTSIINYVLGRHIVSKNVKKDEFFKTSKIASKGLFLSMLNPNSLAFYFFNAGLKKQSPKKILFVPLVMIPYGLIFAYLLFSLKSTLHKMLESPYLMITLILIWFTIAFLFEYQKKKQ